MVKFFRSKRIFCIGNAVVFRNIFTQNAKAEPTKRMVFPIRKCNLHFWIRIANIFSTKKKTTTAKNENTEN